MHPTAKKRSEKDTKETVTIRLTVSSDKTDHFTNGREKEKEKRTAKTTMWDKFLSWHERTACFILILTVLSTAFFAVHPTPVPPILAPPFSSPLSPLLPPSLPLPPSLSAPACEPFVCGTCFGASVYF